jgi:hypothetical protein
MAFIDHVDELLSCFPLRSFAAISSSLLAIGDCDCSFAQRFNRVNAGRAQCRQQACETTCEAKD